MRGYKEEKADSESSILERRCRESREVESGCLRGQRGSGVVRVTDGLKVEVITAV